MPDSSSSGAGSGPEPAPANASDSTRRADESTLAAGTGGPPPGGARAAAKTSAPSQVGRYEVLDRLGAGAWGVVYAAHDPELKRRVAVKVLKWRGADSERRRLLEEARSLARLSHPSVVAVNDVGTIDGQPFIAMAYIEGKTLREWALDLDRADPSSWRRVVDVMLPAAEGLAAVHAAGLVHRDIKPDNILVDARTGRAVLVDFGLALPSAANSDASSEGLEPDRDHETSFEALAGTPAYMAPELFGGRSADAGSDQFALCVTLFEVLYGRRPFRTTPLDAMVKEEVLDSPDARAVPGWLRRVIDRGLELDRSRRWSSVPALMEALERGRRRRRGLIALGLVAVAIGGVSVGLGAWLEREQPCLGADAQLEGAWDAPRREAARDAMVATGVRHAERSAELAIADLDVYADEWTKGYEAACEAHARGEESGDLLDLRIACLRRSRRALAAASEVLARADGDAVENAILVVARLPSLDRCGDAQALQSAAPRPADSTTLAMVTDIERELDEITAALVAGQRPDPARVDSLLVEARASDYGPLIADVLFTRAKMHRIANQSELALAGFEESWHEALGARADAVAVRSALESAQVLGFAQMRLDDAQRRLGDAKSRLQALEQDDPREAMRLRVTLLRVEANLELRRPDPERAIQLVDEALGLLGEDDLRRASLYVSRAWASQARDDYDEALDYFLRARELGERLRGPEHPWVASLGNNIGLGLRLVGRHDEAILELERALELLDGSRPEDAAQRKMVERNLGAAYAAAEDTERAIAAFERALTDNPLEATPPAGLTPTLTRYALALASEGRTDEARARYAQAIRGAEGRARGRDWSWLILLAVELELREARVEAARKIAERGLADLTSRPDAFDATSRTELEQAMRLVEGAESATE